MATIERKTSITVTGFTDKISKAEQALCRSRINTAIGDLLSHSEERNFSLTVRVGELSEEGSKAVKAKSISKNDDEASVEQRAVRYTSRKPFYTFEQLVLPTETLQDITLAVDLAKVRKQVFDDWGLRQIEPFPRTALNFYGPSGTGKTMAAHALADRLGRNILIASYAEIESKYHGDGPKNVQAIFFAAERDNAVLFIDEADSLLSKRLTNVTQGSEQAINSMRSQLLICLEQYQGVVIFSTNLIENYDQAFETRLKHVAFKMPDQDCLKKIWLRHLVPELPLEGTRDEFAEELSKVDGVCGRDIKNAVIDAAVSTALKQVGTAGKVSLNALKSSIIKIKENNIRQAKKHEPMKARDLTDDEKKEMSAKIQKALNTKPASEIENVSLADAQSATRSERNGTETSNP